ncbi:MAG: CHAT domain-containing protein, partial [Candidatus Electrothrix sp. MAN1_4]|nr:CHAT domain-containing protein [Candidatus Electrothrix sp. MAN1_4]
MHVYNAAFDASDEAFEAWNGAFYVCYEVREVCNGALQVGNGAVEAGCERERVTRRAEEMKRITRIALVVALLIGGVVRVGWCEEDVEQRFMELAEKSIVAYRQGNYEQGIPIAEQAYAYGVKHFGQDHLSTLLSSETLALLYHAQKRYSEAEPLVKQAIRLSEQILGKEHLDTLKSINNLAILYMEQGRYSEAEPVMKRALLLCEKILESENSTVLAAIKNLPVSSKIRGSYSGANPILDTLDLINELAKLYYDQGRYSEVEPLYKQVLQFREKMLGKEHPDIVISNNNLGELYRFQGRYSEAEPLYKEALRVSEKVLGKEHSETLTSMNNLAALYYFQGRYSEAEPLYKEALRLCDKVQGKEHPDTLISISNLAKLYQAQGRYREAEPLMKEALQISKKILGREHPNTLGFISNLASLYYAQGRYDEAEPLMKEALQIREKVLRKEHPDTLRSINDLSVLYQAQKHYSKAEPLLQQALKVSEKIQGKEHPLTLTILSNYIYLLIGTNRPDAALVLMQDQESRLLSRSFGELYTSTSERVRRLYLQSISDFQQNVLSLASQHSENEYQQYAAEVMLRWKQVYAEESSAQHRLLNLSNDSEAEQLRTELAAVHAKASQALYQPKEKANISELIEKANQDETALLALARPFRTGLEVKDVTLDKVLAALPQDSGLIEYRLFIPVDFKTHNRGERHLAALLLLTDQNAKQRFVFHDLGTVTKNITLFKDELYTLNEQLIKQYPHSSEISDSVRRINKLLNEFNEKNTTFYEQLLAPFDKQIKNLKQLYIAPDGPLSLLSFASLRLPDGRFLVERQQINRLQTGRDLLENGKDFPRGKGLVAIGGADYGEPPAGQTASTPESVASYRQRAAQMLRSGFDPLPNSEPEAQNIGDTFTNNIGNNVQVFLGKDASEYNLKHLKQPPRILHLSTHGFYFDKDEKSRLSDEAPLLLSGLALAGANNGLQGKPDKHGDDGLLYSLEVLGLN